MSKKENIITPGSLVLLMGPTGSGKGTQSELMSERLGWFFISAGQLLRDSTDPELKAIHDQGKLVPAAKIIKLVFDAINGRSDEEIIVLDGFPRNLDQLDAFKGELAEHHRHVAAVIHLVIDADESANRLKKRGRRDDSPEALKNKLRHYAEEVKPVVDHYRSEGTLIDIDGMESIEDVYRSITESLGLSDNAA